MKIAPIEPNKWGYFNPHFDSWFLELLTNITPEQKERLPLDLLRTLDKGAAHALKSLNIIRKQYILAVAFKKATITIMEDEQNGLGIKDWIQLHKTYRGKGNIGEMVDTCRLHGAFFLGNHDLMKFLSYVNFVHSNNLYLLGTGIAEMPKGRTKLDNRIKKIHELIGSLSELLIHYEGNKKRMKLEYDIDQPEWYALMYFYRHIEKRSREFIHETFIYAQASSIANLKNALTNLKQKKLLDFRGGSKDRRYFLTLSGRELYEKIVNRIVLGF